MPVTFSSKKALRRDQRRQEINKKIKLGLKKKIAEFRKKPTKQGLSTVYRLLDRATKKHLFHHNKAARSKSNLAEKLISKK